ncbi:spindle and kinetochore-associated protein 3 [Cololabis saira]|uniref:spindle and kinetochore-associated protein 3 n=1 Tax=Cololabis saira TaxID=129043 RepID=UPI002AD3892E|nr:spindle and kinetochore-associated protein 3 [Cololabis saira]
MEPTSQFFSKLRRLAGNLEAETSRLQEAFENRGQDEDGESAARAMRVYHEVNSEVLNLKGQIQDELVEQKSKENEVSKFIGACRVMEQRVSKDIETIRTHLEKYGYQAPLNNQRTTKANDAESEVDVAEGYESNPDMVKEESQEDDEGNDCSSPPKMDLPFSDVMRTPQFSDFGLSELELKRTLAGEWCPEVPPMPKMSFPQPSLSTPALPPMPITPKCALRMDEDELQTPQMHDFGITEHTMCLNNDFTMDLLRKNVEKHQRDQTTAPQDIPVPTVDSVISSLQTKVDKLESPERPVFHTPGFNIKKSNGHCSVPVQNGNPESPCHADDLPTTPEAPALQTPYLNRLVSNKKSVRQPDPTNMQTANDSQTTELQATPRNGTTGSKQTWEYNVPDFSVFGVDDKQMPQTPEMPNLEFFLKNSLQNSNGKTLRIRENERVAADSGLEVDGPTQEFSLKMPRIRITYEELNTPERPDLNSITQDICKLVSQTQMKKTTSAAVQPHAIPEKDVHSLLSQAESVSLVSRNEFQALPSYLRQMTLSSLNEAVNNINTFTHEHPGEMKEFTMDKLRKMIDVGTKAPVYVLCLKELKRLNHVDGNMDSAVYKLITQN